jgi:hypothetical protein
MTNTKADFAENHKPATFKANLRLWSDSEPLTPVVDASRHPWPHLDVKGHAIPARGRVKAHIASKHYASSDDIKYDDVNQIIQVLSQWLDKIESGAPPITRLAKEGKIEATLWVAIFGNDEVATPILPEEIDARAKKAGVQILIENYTIEDMDPEREIPTKSFFGAEH